jgi:hypothetical protein
MVEVAVRAAAVVAASARVDALHASVAALSASLDEQAAAAAARPWPRRA